MRVIKGLSERNTLGRRREAQGVKNFKGDENGKKGCLAGK